MKRTKLALLTSLLLILVLALAACGGAATGTATPGTGTDVEPTMGTDVEPTEGADVEPTKGADVEPAAGDIDCKGAAEGDEVTLIYQWSGVEEENFNRIMAPLAEACGIVLRPESTRDQALLDTRVQAGTPPDITFWNVNQLQQYSDQLVPISELGVNDANYADFWRGLGSVDGEWLGLPVKADIKTIIWYSPVTFDAFGYEVPESWEDLEALVEQMVADGNVPWAMGFESGDATGWTGSDFIQDILLVTQGPDFVNGLVSGEVSYNDPAVAEAYEIYGRWASDPAYTVGGAEGTLETGFVAAIYQVFSDPPQAMMVKQSGFAGGEVQAQFPDLEFGSDFDFFAVPGAQGMQGGSDWMMAFSDAPAVQAVFAYLSSEAGGRAWAEAGFDTTPNLAGTEAYTNPGLAKRAQMLAETQGFTPDIGDSIPGGFGSAEWSAIISYVNGGDLEPLLDNVAQAQEEGLAGSGSGE